MSVGSKFSLSAGSVQSDRDLGLLSPDNLKIDDYSLADFMSFVVNHSSQVAFFNGLNVEDGTWANFFISDYPFILAFISSIAIKEESVELQTLGTYLEDSHGLLKSDKGLSAQLVFEGCLKIARRIDTWYGKVISGSGDTKLARELTSSINNSLKSSLIKLKYVGSLIFGNQYELETGNTFKNFSLIWAVESAGHVIYADILVDLSDTTQRLYEQLAEILWTFSRTQSYLISSAKNELAVILENKPGFKPYTALLLAYWEMYSHTQQTVNTFARKHLDFYYENVLRLQKKKAVPDQIFVSFDLQKNVANVTVPAGAALDAGKDKNGHAVIFTTDSKVLVSKSEIVSLMSLYFPAEESPVKGGTSLITDILLEQVATAALSGVTKGWAPFGGDQETATATSLQHSRTTVGFALAAPIFLLQEGNRTVQINLELESDSASKLEQFLRSDSAGRSLNRSNPRQWLSDAFLVSATGKDKWLTLKDASCSYYADTKILSIVVKLTDADKAIGPYHSGLSGNVLDTVHPVLKLMVNNDTPYFFYQLLSTLSYFRVSINVEVDGLETLCLKNYNSDIDSGKPFLPFGPDPLLNSNFYIGSKEFEDKCISTITFNFAWAGVPEKGIKSYYKSYAEPQPTNHSFTMSIAGPDGVCLVSNETDLTEFSLFSAISEKGIAAYTAKGPAKTANSPNKGMFYMTSLLSPDFSILNYNYREAITSVMWQNAKAYMEYSKSPMTISIIQSPADPKPSTSPVTKPVTPIPPEKALLAATTPASKADSSKLYIVASPREPFPLLIKKLTVDYHASMETELTPGAPGQLEVFHIDVASQYKIFPEVKPPLSLKGGRIPTLKLIPLYNKSRYFYLELSGLTLPSVVDVFFQLRLKPAINPAVILPIILWEYLCVSGWKVFDAQSAPVDDTLRLTKSGIIKFILPVDMKQDNPLMPINKYWIRGSTDNDAIPICNIENIYTHAVSATRSIDPENLLTDLTQLPANTVSSLVKQISQIKKVNQPDVSFGGSEAENHIAYYKRVSERLNHKQRAVSSWDFERLLLAKFPELFFVRCLNAVKVPGQGDLSNLKSYRKAGSVTIVVIPTATGAAKLKVNQAAPRLPLVELAAMTTFLSTCSSPLASIEVINAEYIFIKVSCKIKFKDGAESSDRLAALNTAVCDYLSPWKLSNNCYDIKSKISVFDIFSFMEQYPFVESLNPHSFKLAFYTEKEIGRFTSIGKVYGSDRFQDTIAEITNPWIIVASMEKHNLTSDGN